MVHRQKWRYRLKSAYDPSRYSKRGNHFDTARATWRCADPQHHLASRRRTVSRQPIDSGVDASIPDPARPRRSLCLRDQQRDQVRRAVHGKTGQDGVPATAAQVCSAISATASLMRRRWPVGRRVFAIGEKPLFEEFEVSGFALAGETAEIVVLGFDYALTYDKLRTAVCAALNGAAVVVTNQDTLTPADIGLEPCS